MRLNREAFRTLQVVNSGCTCLQGAPAGTSILAIAGTLDLAQKPVLMVSHLEVSCACRT